MTIQLRTKFKMSVFIGNPSISAISFSYSAVKNLIQLRFFCFNFTLNLMKTNFILNFRPFISPWLFLNINYNKTLDILIMYTISISITWHMPQNKQIVNFVLFVFFSSKLGEQIRKFNYILQTNFNSKAAEHIQ